MSTHICENIDRSKLGHSFYQVACKKYYDELRDIHTQVFLNAKRIEAEKTKKRYRFGNVPGIHNLYTFINLLAELLKDKKDVKGVDYSCAAHFFVNDTVCHFKWDVTGYDMDMHAIEDARRRYPESRDHYQQWNLLEKNIPEQDGSQDFVFCNALIQHFSTQEVCNVLKDISRVLRQGGIFALIFKRNIDDWNNFSKKTGLNVHVLDDSEGRVEIEDILMKNAIEKTVLQRRKKIDPSYLSGLRLFHFFSVESIVQMAKDYGLKVYENITFNGKKMDQAVFTYHSGKNIPTAAIFFKKNNSVLAHV